MFKRMFHSSSQLCRARIVKTHSTYIPSLIKFLDTLSMTKDINTLVPGTYTTLILLILSYTLYVYVFNYVVS